MGPAHHHNRRWRALLIGFVALVLVSTSVLEVSSSKAGQFRLDSVPVGQTRSPAYGPTLGSAGPVVLSRAVIGSIPVGSDPLAVVYDDADEELFVANNASLNLTVDSTANDSSIGSVSMAGQASLSSEAYDSESDYAYVAGYGTCPSPGCGGPWTGAIDGTNRSVVLENTSFEQRGGVPDRFDCLGYDPHSNVVYACDSVGRLVVYNATHDTVQDFLPTGSQPRAVSLDAQDGELYVANFGSDNVTVIQADTGSVIKSIPVGSEPDAILFDADDGEVYVANNGSNNVSIIDARVNSVIGSITVGCGPTALADVSSDLGVFVVNGCSDNLTAINVTSNNVVSWIPVGSHPDSIAYAASNGRLYVANAGSDNVTVIDCATAVPPPRYTITFAATGLPRDTEFTVDVNGSMDSSTSGFVAFALTDGPYNYTVLPTAAFLPMHSAGALVVNGSDQNVPVPFGIACDLTFVVKGLPASASWNASVSNLSGVLVDREVVRGPSITELLFANTSYKYAVSLPGNYSHWDASGIVQIGVNATTITVLAEGVSVGSSTFPWDWLFLGISVAVLGIVLTLIVGGRRKPAPISASSVEAR